MMNQKTNTDRGFTLIELLIVVAIIAILAAIAVPNFLEAQTRAKVSRVKADIRSLTTAMEAYRVDNNNYIPSFFQANCAVQGGALEDRYVTLTSPIAYITSTPRDAFGDAVDRSCYISTTSPDNPEYAVFDVMTDRHGYSGGIGPWERARLNEVEEAVFNLAPGDATERLQWYIASQGPDLIAGLAFGFSSAPGAAAHRGLVYDPTNGTTSDGDVIRLGPGDIQQ